MEIDDDKVADAAKKDDVDPQGEMILFIEEMKTAGESIIPDFLVIPQNAPYLIGYDPDRYVETIHALAVEDTWYHGAGDAEWDDPNAGDLQERHDDEWSSENRLKQYDEYLNRGVPIFSVDYCISLENAAQVYEDALNSGLIPLVTRVSLSRMTETPPPGLSEIDPEVDDDRLTVPGSQEINIIKKPANSPDALAQPFAAWVENGELKMAADFDIYQAPVTIYLALSVDHPEYSSALMMFNKEDRLVIPPSGLISWRESSSHKHEVLPATIPTALLPKGEYTFYSLITSEPETLITFSLQMFSMTID